MILEFDLMVESKRIAASRQHQSIRMAFDFLVYQRLGEHRFVTLIVSEPTITEHVYDNVFAKFLVILGSDFGHLSPSFEVIDPASQH